MRQKFLIWLVPAVLLFMFVFFGVMPRILNQQELKAAVNKEKTRVAIVNVITTTRSKDSTSLALPGQIEPYRETVLYARTQGFLKKRLVDIGSEVKAGQLLATIEAPELDQELSRARADLKLANSNLERSRSVTLPGAVAKQELDSREAAYDINMATVRRLEALKTLQEIRAPFKGVITSRNIELGALVNAGGTMPLFTISQQDTLRVFVDVPQAYYRSIKLGQNVAVKIPEMPSKVFTGKVIRTSGALRTQSRTLLTEVIIPNTKAELVSGLYGQVKFHVQQETPPVVIPANTLLVQSEGPKVMLVSHDKTLHLQAVEIGRDFGTSVEIVSGLNGNEQLVLNPTDNLQEGQLVQVRAVETSAK
ncbi:efflux RND transporter periplasmic adaptor subunit [Pontibacter silvestris]|uniref:Efflux RND transporter periplasmic adaptor subunit n=1 Tax=Pontibacter silvestris TaxID=2305183 RepID=A0ABW4WZM1_9BACT|nr:efflux RND transporter periplasmic adaptor subunit [Pontibacter silvestris]MCC9135392.1 efflux RND transporter periplasmic adaptor subunit [Pontibacter silvestris]